MSQSSFSRPTRIARRPPVGVACVLFAVASASLSQSPLNVKEAVRLNNLGVAYMNQQLADKALVLFKQAIAADGVLAVPHLNAGIAMLSVQDVSEAKSELERAAQLGPEDPRVWYNLGLLERGHNNGDSTIQDFQHVLKIDPTNADAHYFLGSAYSDLKEYVHAIEEYRMALHLAPLHASAEFGLARALQHSGNVEEARQHLEHFQRITGEKEASPLGQNYGEQGAYSLAEEIKQPTAPVSPMIPVSFSLAPLADAGKVAPAAAAAGATERTLSGGMCLIDLEGHGKPDLIVLNGSDRAIDYYHHLAEGGYELGSAARLGLSAQGRPVSCAVGDFDNDGHPDLVIAMSDRVVLYRNRGDGTFTDVTEQVGIRQLNKPAGVTFIDFDHDGDLDLFVTGSRREGVPGENANVLWRNNGNQTFTEWTEPTGLGGSGSTVNAILSDLNNDRAVDLAVAGNEEGVTLYMNQREGKFLAMPLYPREDFAPAIGITVFDFNKDGWMDLAVTHAGAPGITLWKNIDGKRFERVHLPLKGVIRAWGITPIDFDNDGWIDLAAIVETKRGTEVRVLRNTGTNGFQDVTAQLKLDKIVTQNARSILASDVDGNGAADLIISRQSGSPLLLRNHGGNRNHSIQIVLHGLADNKSALGTKVEVFAGGAWQKWEVAGASGFLGQGASSILAGLGDAKQPDIVRMLWPTGVPQDEIVPATGGTATTSRMLEITELDRRGSSCPVLFAWDGTKYGFVTDTIGAAVIGHWISPGARNIPDPDEWIKVDGSQLRPDHGFLSLRLGEPMEEVNYIDQTRLVAVDHPDDSEVFPNEHFKNNPPFSDKKTIFTQTAHPPIAVWDNKGSEVSAILRDRDHQYLRDFTNLAYAGFANTHSLTLDLGDWTDAKPLRLLMSGFIEYFSASSLYSAWQAGIAPISPYVDAQMPDGHWKRIVDDMGFPAGLNRTMVADLTGSVPAGTRRIRITTNLQIYWDQILISNEANSPGLVRETELPLASASLGFRGYARQVDGKTPGDLTYYYDQASAAGPFQRQSGLYTHYGDVTPLLKSIDNEFAIFGSGEDIDLEFQGSVLPALPKGWKRDYFFYANGYVKDMDYYEAMPFTVSAMPFHGMSGYPYSGAEHFPATKDALQYQLMWNDRVESGAAPSSYQFHYVPRKATPELPEEAP